MSGIFNGTLNITHDPIVQWESYAISLPHFDLGPYPAFDDISGVSVRSEGGYYRAKAKVVGPERFIEEIFANGLGRHIEIRAPDGGRILWEGKLFKITLDYGSELLSVDLTDIFTKLWCRYRITGSSTTNRSTVYTSTFSLARYGIKEKVINLGEVPSASVADQYAQIFLDMIQTPKPSQEHRENESLHAPFLTLEARGYSECWFWQMYNQTVNTGTYMVSQLLEDIFAAKVQFVKTVRIDSNPTNVQQKFDNDRSAGDIMISAAKGGDPNNNRWLLRMEEGMTARFKRAAPPTIED